MSGGRISWFLVGAATGSLCYYAMDSLVLNQAGKVHKRAEEIRAELVGFVAQPVKELTSKVKESLIAPLQEQVQSKVDSATSLIKPDELKNAWNKGVQDAFGTVSNIVGGGK